VKAARGTWPPFGNVEAEAIAPAKALLEGIVDIPPDDDVVADKLVFAAVKELVGP